MDPTLSVSKGVFVFKNGITRAKGRKVDRKCRSFLEAQTKGHLWYEGYRKLWDSIESQLEKLQTSSYEKILDGLLAFVDGCYQDEECGLEELPTAALLTGINQIDHLSQLETLATNIRNNTFSYVVILQSKDVPSVKVAIETIVSSFVEEGKTEDVDEKKLRKNQMNLPVLKAWYLEKHVCIDRRPNLTVIVPDFELVSPEVLQDLIVILHSHVSCLPFVMIFGVATSIGTIHSVLPYHVTSKIKLTIFQAEASLANLNKILDSILLSPYYPLHLSGKVFQLLLDIFLFYDFSVKGFIQGFKYAMMEHFCRGNIYALGSIFKDQDEYADAIKRLTSSELEQIRQLPSFRPFIESQDNPQMVINYLSNDKFLRRQLPSILINVQNYWFIFHWALEILHMLVHDLPKAPLGKQLRELYCSCVTSDVTRLPEYKECIQLLSFLSKEEMLLKIEAMLAITLRYIEKNDEQCNRGVTIFNIVPLEKISQELVRLADELANASYELVNDETVDNRATASTSVIDSPRMGRQELMQKLLQAAKQPKHESPVTQAINKVINYLTEDLFRKYLQPSSHGPAMHELFLYNDATNIKRHIVGVPRAAIHTALNNPQFYLQCKCCVLDDATSLVSTLPDLSIIYKLHLECGRMINLFDWLQAFRTVIDDNGTAQEKQVDPQIQARFTRAVAELQFLGFIKSSKRKTDHVTRLTW